METVGGNIVDLSPEGAMVVVLAQSLVLFIFSSSGLSSFFVRSGLPPIPMVPVSSSQVIVGCVIGIGLYKGVRNINFKLLGQIAIGWLSTPVMSGILAFFSLFFIKNIFGIDVGYKITDENLQTVTATVYSGSNMSLIFKYILLGATASGIIAALLYYLFERKKMKEFRLAEKKFWKNMP